MDLTALKNKFFHHLLLFLFQELSNDISSDSSDSTTPSSSGTPVTSPPVPASFR